MDNFDVSVKDILGENFQASRDQETSETVKVEAKRKRALKPRTKLDAERLLSHMGLMELDKELGSFVFKGKGHEESDLLRLLDRYELWSQKLISTLDFSDCIDKIDQLGHKKVVKNTIKRYRANLGLGPLTSEYVTENASDNEIMEPEQTVDDILATTDTNFDFNFNMDEGDSQSQAQIDTLMVEVPLKPKMSDEGKLSREEEARARARERLKATLARNAMLKKD